MRLHESDEPLTTEMERELDALEAALAGRSVDPDLAELAELARGLREERPRIRPETAERLDAASAESFEAAGGGLGGRIRRGVARLGGVPPRRLVPALGAAATALIVTGVAISQSGVFDASGGGEPRPLATAEPAQRGVTASGDRPTAGGSEAEVTPLSKDGAREQTFRANRGQGDLIAPAPPFPPGPGSGIAPGHQRRVVERAADLTLSTGRDDVRDVADGVVEVTRRYRGFVLSSNVNARETGPAGAQFDLRIPSARLRPALEDLTGLAHVESLSENVQDITGGAVSARERFRDARAEVRSLLLQLRNAVTLEEIEAIKARLRVARSELAGARGELRTIGQRARLATVHVAIDGTGESVGGGSDWGIGDALDDAVRVLAVSLGVALIGLAALIPVAIFAGIAWAAGRGAVRRRREQALDA